jgi:hypothetical protein
VGGRTTLRLGLLVALILGAIAGAALVTSRTPPGTADLTGSPSPGSPSPRSPSPGTAEATGVVVAVDTGDGVGDVRGFTLRQVGGEQVSFSLRELQNGAEFPPRHLVQHQADAFPVRVVYRMEGSEYLALRLEDAPQ